MARISENPIIQLLNSLHPLPAAAQTDLAGIIRFDVLHKNTEPLRIGQKAQYIYFLHKGLGRVYYLHDGEEITDYFAIDGQFIGAVPGAVTGEASYKAIHLIEDCETYWLELRALEELCLRHPALNTAVRRLLTFALVEEQQRIESLRRYSAAERYRLLEKKYPGLTNRSPLKFIASYLNTSQVSISRIRGGNQ